MDARVETTYTDFDSLKIELQRRHGDLQLKSEIEKFFSTDWPHFVDKAKTPFAFLSRSIFSPTMEMLFFHDILSKYNLNPLFLEYPGDFVSINNEKLYLAKLRFFERTRNNKICYSTKNIVDFQKWEGKPMSEVKTVWDENLIEFHHKFFYKSFPDSEIINISSWFNNVRNKHGKFYYLSYLALAICHGVHFENYLFRNKSESDFFNEKIRDSIEEAVRLFGHRPLIYPVLPLKDEDDNKWLYYRNSALHVLE